MAICRNFQQGYCKYGQNCRFEHVYGTKYSYRAPQNTTNQNDMYNQSRNSCNNYTTNNAASSIFRTAVQNNNASSVFIQNKQSTSVFNRAQTNAPKQNPQSFFAQANQNTYRNINTQVPSVGNPFNQSQQSSAKSLFAQATQNVFGQNQNNNFTENKSDPKNIFATAARPVLSSQSHFSNVSVNTQILKEPSNVFGNLNNSFNKNNYNGNEYSKMEDLSPSDVEAFESNEFKLYLIPEIPPPRSLCVTNI